MTPIERILAKLPGVQQAGNGWSARCPAHDDSQASLSIGVGDDGRVLLHCHAGCEVNAVVAALGIEMRDLMSGDGDENAKPSTNGKDSSPAPARRPRKVHCDRASAYRAALWSMGAKQSSKHWEYHNRDGESVGMVIRVNRPDGSKLIKPIARVDGGWVVGHMPEPRPLYRVKAALRANRVFVTEGEKAADAGVGLGLACTTSAGGANAARMSDWSTLADAESVVLFPDNDDAGETYVHDVLFELARLPQRPKVYVVRLPGLPDGGDLFDWVAERQGRPLSEARAELDALVATATPVDLEEVQANAPLSDPPRHDNDQTKGGTASASKERANRQPTEEARFQPFPTDVLPEPVASFVRAASKAMGCDESYVAVPLLVGLAAAVGNSRRIELKRSWCEPCVIWAIIVGESGTLKSPAMDAALAPLRRIQAEAWRDFERECERYEQEKQIYEADYQAWKTKGRKKGEPPPTKPVEPICRRLIAEDTTVEALAVLLVNQPRGLLVARDEVSGLLNSFDAYKSARGADVAHWLAMHRAGSCLVDRKTGRKTIRVPRAAVSVTGGVQPKTLKAALAGRYQQRDPEDGDKAPPREHFENGLAARLLLAMPPRMPKKWTDADIDVALQDAIDDLFDTLASLTMLQDANDEPAPVDVPASPEAKQLFIAFYNENAVEQCELDSDLAAAWSKIEGYAARFALLFWLIRRAMGAPTLGEAMAVDAESMAAGIELARWFAEEAARVYSDLGGCHDFPSNRYGREERRLIGWIRRQRGRVTVRDLTRGPRRFRGDDGAAKAERALQALVDMERGRWETVGGDDRGRPTRVFVLADGDEESAVSETATVGDGDENQSLPANERLLSPSPHDTVRELWDGANREETWGEV